jgi:hypothetical protein
MRLPPICTFYLLVQNAGEYKQLQVYDPQPNIQNNV